MPLIFVILLPSSYSYNIKLQRNDIRGGKISPLYSQKAGQDNKKGGKVTIVGAGFYGSQVAFRLAQYDIFDTIVLTDIADGRSEGIALDINQCSSIEGFNTDIVGVTTIDDSGYEKTAESDIVIITAGIPRKPGMSRSDLLGINSKIIEKVVTNVSKYSPNAILIVVSNPIDEMVALAQRVSKFSHRKVVGQAGLLDASRMSYFVAKKLNVEISKCSTLTLGSHGDAMIPVVSRSTVDGRPLSELLNHDELEEICKRTRDGGAEIVSLLKTGSAFFCPAVSAAKMARAIMLDTNEIITCHTYLTGQYGLEDLYIGVETRLGKDGAIAIESSLNQKELEQLKSAANILKTKQKELE